jgi:uncharacterized protein involved in exopolysaccharide biosynthesis
MKRAVMQLGLDHATNSEAERDKVVNELVKDITIRPVPGRQYHYVISYRHQKPEVAKTLVSALLSSVIEDILIEVKTETADRLSSLRRAEEDNFRKVEIALKNFKDDAKDAKSIERKNKLLRDIEELRQRKVRLEVIRSGLPDSAKDCCNFRGQEFRIIEPAFVNKDPVFPSRKGLILLALITSVLAGFAVMVIKSFYRNTMAADTSD